jgi:hypothetical protein
MAKSEQVSDFYGLKPRKLDKKKHHSRGFTEESHDHRARRINFKNYVRQVREQELGDDIDREEWIVEQAEVLDDKTYWTEIGSFANRHSAEECVEEQEQNDNDTFSSGSYRIRKA